MIVLVWTTYYNYKKEVLIFILLGGIGLGIAFTNVLHQVVPSTKEKVQKEVIRNFEGKIPQNGKIITEATFCFKDDELTKISLDGKCPK